MRKGLTLWVFLATLLGGAFGLACHAWVRDAATLSAITGTLGLVSTIFLRLIKMLIAPLVLATLVSGIGRMGDSGAVGRVALKALIWFITGSVVAMAIGLAMVEIIQPGAGLHLSAGQAAGAAALKAPPMTLTGFLTNLVPTSILDAMARNEVLQIVVFGVFAGVALTRLGAAGKELLHLAEVLTNLMLKMAGFVMNLAPIAVFAAVGVALAQQGTEVVAKYLAYVGGFYVALALLWACIIGAGVAVLGGPRQWHLMKAIREPALIALATTSSEAAYPVLLYKLEQAGVPNRIASFVLPLGYSFNLIGSMCYCTFAALFVAQAYDVPLTATQIAQLLFLVFVASKGIANVPRASLVVVVALMPYFNLPEAGALLILGVDHFLDMGRTCTNTVATAIAAASVAKWEGTRWDGKPPVRPAPARSASVRHHDKEKPVKLDHTASGVYAIAPTPFLEGGAIDWTSVDRMTDFYFECGCNGFTVLGVLGEAPKLDAEEALAVATRVIKRAAGKQIIVGVSAAGFAAMRSLTHKVMELGAAGVMIAPGAGLKTDEQITGYFRGAIEAIGPDVPWVLQDYPFSTGVTMTPKVVRQVVMENPSLAILKHEDWPGLDKITTLRGWERDGSMRPVSILVGNNGLFLDFELDRGVDGANTGYAFPDMLVDTVKLTKAGKRDAAHDLFDAHLPLLRYDHQPGVGLAVRKYVLQRRGVLATAVMRKPAPAFTMETRAEVDYLLARLAKRDPRAKL